MSNDKLTPDERVSLIEELIDILEKETKLKRFSKKENAELSKIKTKCKALLKAELSDLQAKKSVRKMSAEDKFIEILFRLTQFFLCNADKIEKGIGQLHDYLKHFF